MTVAPGAAGIAARIEAVRERVAAAARRSGRAPSAVTLIAVSKTFGAAEIAAAYDAGQRHFGENYIQEFEAKRLELAAFRPDVASGATFHFIGHLQTNKVAQAVALFPVVHGVDSARAFEQLSRRVAPGGCVHCFLEVNLAGEPGKSGAWPGAVPVIVDRVRALPAIDLIGLMAVPPRVAVADDARPYFRQLRALAQASGLTALSMGMSDDFEAAIEEGATHVRVGRAIFGERSA